MGDNLTDINLNIPIQSVRPIRDRTVIDPMTDASSWSETGDAIVLENANTNILGANSIVAGKPGAVALTSGMDKTLSKPVNASEFLANDLLTLTVFILSLSDIASLAIRLGTNSTNFSEWVIPDTDLTTNAWNIVSVPLGSPVVANQLGSGHNFANIRYVSVFFTFDNTANALDDMFWYHIHIEAANN